MKAARLALTLVAGAVKARCRPAPPSRSRPPQPNPAGRLRCASSKWEEMVPAGWDPAARLRNRGDLSRIQERSQGRRAAARGARDLGRRTHRPELNGCEVRLPGYLVPLEGQAGEWKEFLLVPYFGACIHSPPPPANQIVHVKAAIPAKGPAQHGHGLDHRTPAHRAPRHRHGRQRLQPSMVRWSRSMSSRR